MAYLTVQRPSPAAYIPLETSAVRLVVRQHPQHALVTHDHKEKGRKPLDPPPIVQMHVDASHDPNEYWLVNPFLFMMATLIDAKTDQPVGNNTLIGQNVSSLHRLKDVDNKDGGYFVFGDISCRRTGMYKLQFNLYDYDKMSSHVNLVDTIMSTEFKVSTSKEFKGLAESTQLSRHFSEQGVRLRLRKEPRTLTGSKRAWNASPPEPAHNSHVGMYGGPVHSHNSYGMPPVKRQRSNEDFSASYMYSSGPYQMRPSQAQYGGSSFSSDGSAQQWAHDQKAAYSTDPSLTGMMTPGQTHPNAIWQRGMPMSGYPASSAGGYFSNASAPSRPPTGYLPSQGYAPAPSGSRLSSSSSTGAEGYPSMTGLHTPTSLNEHPMSGGSASVGSTASTNQAAAAAILHTPQSVHGQLPSQPASHPSSSGRHQQQQQQSDLGRSSSMAHFTGRGLTLEQPVASHLNEAAAAGGAEYIF